MLVVSVSITIAYYSNDDCLSQWLRNTLKLKMLYILEVISINDRLSEKSKLFKEKLKNLNIQNMQGTVFWIFICSFYCLFERIPIKMYLYQTCVLWVFK